MKSLLWCAAAPLVLAGCSDADPPPDDEPGARAIRATEARTMRAADGAIRTYPTDLDQSVVQVYARDAAGAWATYAGEGRSDGTLQVDAVPPGDAWLRIDYFDTSAEPQPHNEYFRLTGEDDVALELGTWGTGRDDVHHASAGTQVRFDMSGLLPWQPDLDKAIVYTPNAAFVNVFNGDGEGISGMPVAGATGSSLQVAWAEALGAPLLAAGRGDRSWMMQFRFTLVDGAYVGAPIRVAELPGFTVADEGATTVPIAFTAPATTPVRVAMDRDAFDAFRPEIGDRVGPSLGRTFAVSATPTPVAGDLPRWSTAAELVVVDGKSLEGGGPLDLGDVAVASPFPAEHTFGRFVSYYPVTVPRDDGVPARCIAEIGVLTTTLPSAAAPAAPIIGPVRNLTIGGHGAFEDPTAVGLTPEIRWSAPALGTPSEYEIRVLAPGGADPTYDYVWYPAAIFHVPATETSLVLPPELLLPDWPYAIHIRAITQPLEAGVHAANPRRVALPYGWADTITPAFKP